MESFAATIAIEEEAERHAAIRWPNDLDGRTALIAGYMRAALMEMEVNHETPRQYAERLGLIDGGQNNASS